MTKTLIYGSVTGILVGLLATQARTVSVVTCQLKGVKMSSKGVVIDSVVYAPVADVASALKTNPSSQPARKDNSALKAIEGKNLVINGDFESSNGIFNTSERPLPIFGWQSKDGAAVAKYEGGDVKIYTGDRPENCSDQYFGGGKGSRNPTITQVISLVAYGAEIESGKVSFSASALLSGFSSQPDIATFILDWKDSSGKSIWQNKIEGPTPLERRNYSKFFQRAVAGKVPKGSTQVVVSIVATGGGGTWIDGYADNVVLTLRGSRS